MRKSKREKKQEQEEEIVEEEQEEELDEIYKAKEQLQEETDFIDSSTEIAGQIHKQAKIITQNFPHAPTDLKYGNFDKFDKMNYRYRASGYRNLAYLRKLCLISEKELIEIKLKKIEEYNIKDIVDLKEFLKSINKTYLLYDFLKLTAEKQKEMYDYIIKLRLDIINTGIIDDLYLSSVDNFKTDIWKVWTQGSEENDDIGFLNDMIINLETGKAYKNTERKNINTTINVTKEEPSLTEQTEEVPEEMEGKSGIFNKFKKR